LYNVRRQHKQVRLFEVGHVVELHADGALSETEQVGVLLHGDRLPEQWSADKQSLDFFDLKGMMTQFFESQMQMPFDTACRLEQPENPLPCFHPKQVAHVFYQDRLIGMMGVLHPRLLRASGQEGGWLYGQWMNIDTWLAASPQVFESYSSFPAIRRDICFFMPDGIECEDVIRYIREQESQDLQKIIVFDEYRDDKADVGRRRSLAIGMIFQNKDRSLTDEEVSRIVEHWVKGLHQALNVSMR
jgi:phenylalanyl-tRNA synthetase beta chain